MTEHQHHRKGQETTKLTKAVTHIRLRGRPQIK